MRKPVPQKLWMSLIAFVSVFGSYSLFFHSYESEATAQKVIAKKALEAKTQDRNPASAPLEDGAASGKAKLLSQVSIPRAPAQEHFLSPEKALREWTTQEIQVSKSKYRLVEDVVVVSRSQAIEWGSQIVGELFNQVMIEKSELPAGEKFRQLIFSEKKMNYSILTNNIKLKMKSDQLFQEMIVELSSQKILRSFPAIKLIILEASSIEDAQNWEKKCSSDSRIERCEREIISRSSSPQ